MFRLFSIAGYYDLLTKKTIKSSYYIHNLFYDKGYLKDKEKQAIQIVNNWSVLNNIHFSQDK